MLAEGAAGADHPLARRVVAELDRLTREAKAGS